MEKFVIGRILKPRGLKGELKVQILTNKQDIYDGLRTAFIGGKEHKIIKSSVQNGFAYFSVDGVNHIDRAEDLRNLVVEVDASNFPMDDDEMYADDFIGMTVSTESGKVLGKVVEVLDIGGGSVLDLGGDLLVPYEDEFIIETNTKANAIIVRAEKMESEEIR